MKKNIIRKAFSRHLKEYFVGVLFLSILFPACVDTPININTVTQDMMGQYLQNRPDSFSEFVRLLDTTQVMGLMNAYGKYTMFAPNNNAMHAFYISKGRNSLKGFPLDTLKKIAYDHIMKGYKVQTSDFIDGLLPYTTMSDRYVSTTSKTSNGSLVYYVNVNSAIITKDIITGNGIIQVINKVLDPSVLNLVESIAADEKFKIFSEALAKTGLADSLKSDRDFSYDPLNYSYIDVTFIQGSGSKDELPAYRKYGFTALMESDATFNNKYGIRTLDDLKAYASANVYNEDPNDATVTDITDRRNSLNKFIAYHLINKKLTSAKFIDAYDNPNMLKTFDMYEYVETMSPNTLMEIKKERATGETNLINKSTATGNAVRIIATDKDNDATNGVYHEIDNILIYNSSVAGELSSKRLRMDAASFFPEVTNNDMRYFDPLNPRSWVFPQGYIKRLTCSSTTRFCYLNAFEGYLDYEGDEVYLKGMYDFTVETPPVPAGTYEVRFCYQPTGGRGAAQLYWDGVPCGIPLDLRILANDPLIGFETPGSNSSDYVVDDQGNVVYGVENDKMMRNRGYMKGPSTYKEAKVVWYGGLVARDSPSVLRRILGTYTFTKSGNHYLSVKAVVEGQFMMDFLEFVPVEMLGSEDIQ